ncbi:GTPase Era [Fundidesulfovibrio butyratiphilus]
MSGHKFGYVALIGPPNAGKSTLLNALLGQKLAIVTPKPQTTRNQLTGILTRPDAQIVFLDTPGVHVPRGSRLNSRLVESAWRALAQAQLAVVVLDAAKYSRKPEIFEADLKILARPIERSGLPVLVLLNKMDALPGRQALLPLMARLGEVWPGAPVVPVSALKQQGLESLVGEILAFLPEGAPQFDEDQLSTAPLRFLAAEIIREKLFLALSQELPYNTAVGIEQWRETSAGARVSAVIYVSQNRHKGMVIGKGGALLKQVGTQARQEIMELIGQPAHLDLWVKVREGWTEDVRFMNELDDESGV